MSWTANQKHYQDVARGYWPAARLTTRLSWLTGGRPFALGPLQVYPKHWPSLCFDTVAHEAGHNWTYELLGWLVPVAGWFFGRAVRAWCGVPFFLLLYYAMPPWVGFAPCRAWFELLADRRRWRRMLAAGCPPSAVHARADRFGRVVNQSWAYGYALPWLGLRWYRRAARRVLRQAARTTHGAKY